VAAVENGIAGVTVSFGHKIINGTRAVKTSTDSFDAFTSVNSSPMATAGAFGINVADRATGASDSSLPPIFDDAVCPDVFLLKLVPGINPSIFDVLSDMGCRGIVIEAFGAGGVCNVGRDAAVGIERAVGRGIPVVACSQCLYGRVDLSAYEASGRIMDAGVIPAGDMTAEASVTKLMWALGKTDDMSEIRKIFRTNYAGEVTI
jgi:L-asparaginase